MRRYEDFAVGDVYRSAVGRTVTETDNLLFTMLSLNTNELHFNEEAAKETEWGRILVNSTFTLALVLGLSVAWHVATGPSADPAVAALLQPTTYPIGTKRMERRPADGSASDPNDERIG